jgi:AcrR family transcriptional regulator
VEDIAQLLRDPSTEVETNPPVIRTIEVVKAEPDTHPRPRLRADAERNRRRILEAAAEEFAERGLAVSLDDIAARAEVGVGTVYRRFPDRESLINALFEERVAEFIQMAERSERHPDAWEGLVGFIREGTEFHGRNRALKELMFSAPGGRDWVDHVRQTVRPKVARVVKRAQREGKLRADFATLDVPLIEVMLSSVIEFTAGTAPDVWQRLLTYVLDGLRPSRTDPTPLDTKPLSSKGIADTMMRSGRGR